MAWPARCPRRTPASTPPPSLTPGGPACSCHPDPVRAVSTSGDLQPPPAPARRGRSLEPVRGPRLPTRLYRTRVLPRRRPGTAMRGARAMASRTGHAIPDRVGYAWGTDANRLIAPLLQIPDLPVIGFPPVPF